MDGSGSRATPVAAAGAFQSRDQRCVLSTAGGPAIKTQRTQGLWVPGLSEPSICMVEP